MNNKLATSNKAHQWMLEGIKQHEEFVKLFRAAKDRALNAGFFFLSAKAQFEHGEWLAFVGSYKISPRTVQFYVQFTEEVIEWVKRERPTLEGTEKLSAAAREMVLQSPKGLVALCRELSLMRKFGEYDEVKYRAKKLGAGAGQIEFDFSKVMAPLDVLCHFGDENYSFNYPEGVDTVQFMTEVETKLEAALARVRQIKQHGRVIET